MTVVLSCCVCTDFSQLFLGGQFGKCDRFACLWLGAVGEVAGRLKKKFEEKALMNQSWLKDEAWKNKSPLVAVGPLHTHTVKIRKGNLPLYIPLPSVTCYAVDYLSFSCYIVTLFFLFFTLSWSSSWLFLWLWLWHWRLLLWLFVAAASAFAALLQRQTKDNITVQEAVKQVVAKLLVCFYLILVVWCMMIMMWICSPWPHLINNKHIKWGGTVAPHSLP